MKPRRAVKMWLSACLLAGLAVHAGEGPKPSTPAPTGLRQPATVPPPRTIAPPVPLPPPATSSLPLLKKEPLPRDERLQSFNPLSVQVRRRDGRWTVEAGDLLLKDCGRRQQDAWQVCRLIQQLGLDQRGVIGSPQPVMEYWLTRGRAPSQLPGGLRVLRLHPERLTLEKSQGFWVLREPGRVLFNFGPDEKEARQALAVIRKYGFERIGVVGQAIPSMLVLAGDAEGIALSSPEPIQPVKHEEPQKAEPAKPSASPAFYPTPILPPLPEPTRETELIDRGRPSQLARQMNQPTGGLSPVASARFPFDARQVQLRRENADWVLSAGSLTLARFGQAERHARIALAALLHYRLSEMITIGSPEKPVRYYLSSGQAPRGLMAGVMGERFLPERLIVRQIGEHHVVCQGNHPVLDCGPRREDAEHMRQVIRRYGFDHVLRIGQSDQACMTILVRSF